MTLIDQQHSKKGANMCACNPFRIFLQIQEQNYFIRGDVERFITKCHSSIKLTSILTIEFGILLFQNDNVKLSYVKTQWKSYTAKEIVNM